MMNQRLHIILLITYLLSLIPCCCFAAGISSDELIQNAKEYDGKEVVFQGEVIGDIMKRGKFYWVNISDGKNAIGVFLDAPMPIDIKFTGDYSHIGDTVEVKGIFHRACLKHGGDLDIHAGDMSKIKDGYMISHAIDQCRPKAVLWLTGILFVLVAAALIDKKLKKKHDGGVR